MKERTQFNTRQRHPLKLAASRVCEDLGFTRDELVEVALATVFGSSDGLIREKRKKIQESARQLKLELPFNEAQVQLPGFDLAA